MVSDKPKTVKPTFLPANGEPESLPRSLNGGHHTGASQHTTRVVLLGASNLTRGISTVVRLAQMAFGGPLDLLAALGHGRSYGMTSRVLFRELPGIESCGLWQALSDRPPLPTAALLTDVGNDIFYGASLDEITGWVELALDRLALQRARIIMTLLPDDNAASISEWRFRLMRRMMFNRCRLGLNEVKDLIAALNQRLQAIAVRRSIHVVAQRANWYGFDPLHIRMRHWPRAWSEILDTWQNDSQKTFSPETSLSRWLYLRSLAPLERTVLRRVHRAEQPSGRLSDGSAVSYY
jgi:hypothetical protein